MNSEDTSRTMSVIKSRNSASIVYILAASHSGSTLTALLLNSHPRICTTGELKVSNMDHPDEYRCSCRQLIQECDYWRQVTSEMDKRGVDFDILDAGMSIVPTGNTLVDRFVRPLHRGKGFELARDIALNIQPKWRKFIRRWQQRNYALISSILSVSGADYVVDSSKTGVRLKYLRQIPDLDVKVIRLKRDGRGVALTYMDSDEYADAKDVRWRGGGTGPTSRPKLSMEEAAKRWLRSNQEADAVLKFIPDSDVLEVSYEELCNDTKQTLFGVYEFLGVEKTELFESFRASPHHVIGNGMRLDTSNDIVLDDRWTRALTREDLDVFDKVAGDLNRRYGYS